MRDLALKEMNLARPIILGSKVQHRCRQVQALQRNEIARVQVAKSSARVTGSRVRPRAEEGLNCGPEFGQFEWLFDELNRVRAVAFRV